LPREVEFRKIVLEGNILEHYYSWRKTSWWTWKNYPKYCWFFVASCNMRINSKRCMG
jgi:hypothetical protein